LDDGSSVEHNLFSIADTFPIRLAGFGTQIGGGNYFRAGISPPARPDGKKKKLLI
jgi:hypothetical protein